MRPRNEAPISCGPRRSESTWTLWSRSQKKFIKFSLKISGVDHRRSLSTFAKISSISITKRNTSCFAKIFRVDHNGITSSFAENKSTIFEPEEQIAQQIQHKAECIKNFDALAKIKRKFDTKYFSRPSPLLNFQSSTRPTSLPALISSAS